MNEGAHRCYCQCWTKHTHNPLWFAQKHNEVLVAHNGKVRNIMLYVMGDLEIEKITCELHGKIDLKGL
jgi:hypothetical protein